MFDVTVDKRRKKDSLKACDRSGKDSEPIKVEAEPDLEPEDDPDKQDE